MPFKDVSVNDQRREFVLLAQRDDVNMSELCRRFGISRSHGYALVDRANRDGIDALDRQSRRPHTSPRQISPEMEARIVDLRTEHPDWGARKLHARLAHLGFEPPAQSTITQVLHRNDLMHPPPGGHTGTFQRFERSAPNELWQMDFLGHKPLQSSRVHPLTIIDDHSRYGLTLAACANESRETVWGHLHQCFAWYGLPWAILTDNAPPWGHTGFAITMIEMRLMQLGIRLIHGRPYHPQTQGKIERWHRTISRAVFGPIPFRDLHEAQIAFDAFLTVYNTERPHEALANDVPISRFRPSGRSYPSRIEPPSYDDDLPIRKVRQSGEIMFEGKRIPISKSLAGEWVAVQPTREDSVVHIVYYTTRIRTIDLSLHTKDV